MPVRTAFEMENKEKQGQQLFNDDLWISNNLDASLYMSCEEEDFRMSFLDISPSELLPALESYDSHGLCDFNDFLSASSPASSKYQIRHHDCMWSGTCVDKSHPNKKKGGYSTCPTNISNGTATAATTNSNNQVTVKQELVDTPDSPIIQVVKPNEVMQNSFLTNINNCKLMSNKNIMSNNNIFMKSVMKADKIPAGRSLLLNSNNKITNLNKAICSIGNQSLKPPQQTQQVEYAVKSEFPNTVHNLRPDTPLSLGDDPPELKTMKINMLREHLEDQSDMCFTKHTERFSTRCSTTDLTELLHDIQYLSDYDDNLADENSMIDMEDETDESLDGNENNDYDQDDELKTKNIKNFLTKAVIQSENVKMQKESHEKFHQQGQTQQQQAMTQNQYMGDHSYTRPKSRYDMLGLGVQTPSDSGEFLHIFHSFYIWGFESTYWLERKMLDTFTDDHYYIII